MKFLQGFWDHSDTHLEAAPHMGLQAQDPGQPKRTSLAEGGGVHPTSPS
jgi:hypothetical protein